MKENGNAKVNGKTTKREKTYDVSTRVSAEARKAIEYTIAKHNLFKGNCSWSPRNDAVIRRWKETSFCKDNPDYRLVNGSETINVSHFLNKVGGHTFWSLQITLNGIKKDIRTIKRFLKSTNAQKTSESNNLIK